MYQQTIAPPARKKMSSKLIAGFAAFLASGIITASGLAGATANPGNGGNGNRPQNTTNTQRVNTNQSGTINLGYGGGNTSVINNISLNLNNSNNNIIQVIVNIFR